MAMATPSPLLNVLAPQSPKKYYIHNNIFRYQDSVFMEAAGDTGTNKDNNREAKKTTF